MEVGKKGSISEDDISVLLQRYSVTTILALLQEVSQFAGVKIDWNTLVKSTSTGISNAREYQMLWRYLAYRDSLLENIEDGAEPLDDDSDLEFELEASPASSPEALSEIAAWAKVLISSGSPHDSGPTSRSTVQAPLTINIPNDQTPCLSSDKQQLARPNRGTNITVPVSVQKQPLPAGQSTEGLDGNGSAGSGLPAKKKRKLWTEEEDMELIAAVQKCGEGNWANILKGDFKHNRTASQLSQRWAIIRRRQAKSNPDGGNKMSSSTRSEERLAAQKAFSMAVDMPMTGSLSAVFPGTSQPANSSTFSAAISEAPTVSASQALDQHQHSSNHSTSQKGGLNPLFKPQTTPRKPSAPLKPSVCPNPLIQAAAFAAGGRIANPSTAASLFKAAQSKNAVHIRPRGVSLSKSSATGAKLSSTSSTSGPQAIPNFRQIRPPVSSSPTLTAPKLGRAASFPLTSCVTASNLSTQQTLSESKAGTLLGTGSQESGEPKSEVTVSAIDVDELLSEEVGGGDEIQQTLSESKPETLGGSGSQESGQRRSEASVSAIDVDELLSEEVGCGDETQQSLSESKPGTLGGSVSQENDEQKREPTVSAIDVDKLLSEEVGGVDETHRTLSESKSGTLGGSGSQETGAQKSEASVSAIAADELSKEEGGRDEMELDDAVTRDGRIDNSNSQVIESEIAVKKADELEKEATEKKVAAVDAGGTQIPVGELRERGGVDDVRSPSRDVNEEQLNLSEVAGGDEVKDLSSENNLTGIKSPVDGQASVN